ncbi:MAG: proprotein convertase P-domain-containing protein [Sandaracinaceae bacterium]|nr:proprotein convertase P-domain-containing protein [Sandaracinaceae bacterium]
MTRLPVRAGLATLIALAGCGSNEPRFGVLGVSAAAPHATLSGHTSAQASPALELSPGCPGFVDPATPEHLLRVTDGAPFTVSASSTGGPLAIAVAGEGEVRCDSDGGSGHTPHVAIDQPGEYLVYVGALTTAQDLPYELSVRPSAEAAGTGGAVVAEDTRVSVTITSDPPGATVRTPEGEVLGTTPAMFVLPVPGDQVGQERRFVLEMPGHRTAEVTGRLLGGSMVLHASLLSGTDTPPPPVPPTSDPGNVAVAPPPTTGELTVATTDAAQPVRDYSTVEQHLEVTQDCTIGRAAVVLDLQHSYVADLRVSLRAPSGTEVVLHNHQSGGRRALATTIDWDDRRGVLHALAGQNARGRWTLVVRDSVGADGGTLHTFSMRFSCGAPGTVASVTPSTSSRPPRTYGRGPRSPQTGTGLISPWGPATPAVPIPPTPPRTTGRSNPRGDGVVDPWQ